MIYPISTLLNTYAKLITYPNEELHNNVDECYRIINENKSHALKYIEEFSGFVKDLSIDDLQEYYTRTFEINPTCALEVGWHLFGERYERGTFIVKMRQTLRQYGLEESTELPDHLYHVIEALSIMEYEEAMEFSNLFLLPALEKMLEGFKGKENMYVNVIKAVQCEVKNHYKQSTKGACHE